MNQAKPNQNELVNSIIASAIKSTRVLGGQDEWPSDAEFAIGYRAYCWPTYDQRDRVAFFKSLSEVESFLKGQRRFASLEDNYFDFQWIDRWDLGPVESSLEELGLR